jgi:hypothetical protein
MAIHVNNETVIFPIGLSAGTFATVAAYSPQAESGTRNCGRHLPADENGEMSLPPHGVSPNTVPGICPHDVTGRAPPAEQLAKAVGRGKLLTP